MRQTTKKKLVCLYTQIRINNKPLECDKNRFLHRIASRKYHLFSNTHASVSRQKNPKKNNVLHQLHVLFPSLSGRLHLDRARLQEGVRRRHRGQGGAGGGKEDTGETRIPTCLKIEQKTAQN